MPADSDLPSDRAAESQLPPLDELLARHLPALRAFVRLRTDQAIRERASASDLVQSVCREVLEGVDRIDYRGEAAFRAFLFTAALSKIRDVARFHRRDKRDVRREAVRLDDSSAGAVDLARYYSYVATPSRVLMDREAIARIEEAFDGLSEEHREVLTLARIVGLGNAEIAERLGKSESAVKALISRARRRLSGILSRFE